MLAILEAAERVRPRKTSTERVHRHRARKRAARNDSGVGGNVSGGVTPAAANGETLPETLLATAGNVSSLDRLAVLYTKLIDAASGNVQPAATDTSAIAALLEQGCDLDL